MAEEPDSDAPRPGPSDEGGSTLSQPPSPDDPPQDSTGLSLVPAGRDAGDDGEFSLDSQDVWTEPPPGPIGFPNIPGYEVESELGRGGMGVVYKARQVSLNRVVALKMVLAGDFASSEQLVRFLVEAETIGRLQHPNIVQIHEFGTFEGRPFFSLEYVGGGSLGAKPHRRQHGPREAARLMEPVARAIDYAHSRGVVHRDLKPANVLLTPDGTPKLSDFGLAKTQKDSGLTRSGVALGTPSFMAPEQAQGDRALGPSSDIFALGAILYQLLAGRPPFHAENPVETMLQVVNDDPEPLRQVRKDVPRDLEAICQKCLEKDPKNRYATAGALAEDLRRFLAGVPPLARGLPAPVRALLWANRHPARTLSAVAVLLAVGLSFGAIGLAWRAADLRAEEAEALARRYQSAYKDSEEARRTAEARSAGRRARLALVEGQARCRSGDVARGLPWLARAAEDADKAGPGLRAVVSANLGRWAALLARPGAALPHPRPVRSAAAGTALLATACADGLVRRWSPEGRPVGSPLAPPGVARPEAMAVAFASDTLLAGFEDGRVCRWDADGQPVGEALVHPAAVAALAVSPDGGILFVACADGTVVRRQLPEGKELPPRLAADSPLTAAVAPSSGRLLTTGRDGIPEWDAPAGKPSGRLAAGAGVTALAIAPGGRLVLAGGRSGARIVDAETGRTVGAALPHAEEVTAVAFAPDGVTCATADSVGRVRIWEAATGLPTGTSWAESSAGVAAICFAPEGRSLLAAGADGTVRLWTLPAPPPAPVRVPGPVLAIGWTGGTARIASPDGARDWPADGPPGQPIPWPGVAQSAVFGPGGWAVAVGNRIVWRHGERTFTPPPAPADVAALAISPDGGTLLALLPPTPDRGNLRGWEATPVGATPVPLGWDAPPADSLAAGPDGLLLLGRPDRHAYLWDTIRAHAIGRPWPQPEAVSALAFGPAGKLAAVGCRDGTLQLWEPSTGRPAAPPLDLGPSVTALAFSPDGSRLLAGTADGLAWEVDTGSGLAVGPPLRLSGRVGAAAWGPAGCLAAGDRAGLLRRRTSHPPESLPEEPAAVRMWAETLAGWRVEDDGTERPLPGAEWWREDP